MKRYAFPFLISAIVPTLLYLPFLIFSALEPLHVWIYAVGCPVLGMLMGLKVAIRDDVRDRTNEEAMYFYTASPAMITFVVQAVVVVAISYMDGGIFIRLDLKGWLFVFAGVVAFIAWLKFPTYLARRFDSELKRPNKPVQTRPTSRPV